MEDTTGLEIRTMDDMIAALARHERWGDQWADEVEGRLHALEQRVAELGRRSAPRDYFREYPPLHTCTTYE